MKRCVLALALLTGAACDLQPQTRATGDSRLVITKYVTDVGDPNVWFIRDTVSEDCWIVVGGNGEAVALQRASPASCSRGESPK